jgi:hypothetical protein
MKKLLYKTALFVMPIFILFIISKKYYSTNKGDLLRVGYIVNTDNYDFTKLFREDYKKKINFTKFSEINLKKQNNFTVFTIGDSFSEQGPVSYQNYLANSNIKVLHLDKFLHDNPIETIGALLNGDVFDNIKVDYIILQSVERKFLNRAKNINKKMILNKKGLKELIADYNLKMGIKSKKKEDQFFIRAVLNLPLNYILYNFKDNAFSSKTYQVKTRKNIFSTNNHKLLFSVEDIEDLKTDNNKAAVELLNNELNNLAEKLKAKGIKLIVLPSPDKFDFYYDDIVNKNDYTRPILFDCLRKLKKEYIYIDSKKILEEKTNKIKDVYFYDDTHWSPIAAQIIGDELKKIIEK